ncbi:phosphoethanolamine--lipid A transferase EptA [Lysobacter sp. KIS68-7]|uniref:phosphoethanolamine--lipid A transferase EptA n=1 Tax=Lysobacter sp. KIS68-7 TaxID=2904252 RepID=UPI001E4235A6|nr:phosphoethanolamine--lipid A transferase EptA [Lysobacter sp. KIS68-7]UHQ20197.1 phosphoethanolamine--lipid A transferase EptA [Lysobacter sp. KIS68-7]
MLLKRIARNIPGFPFSCGYPTFVFGFTLANMLLFGWPLFSFAASTTRAISWPGMLDLLILSGLQVVLMVMLLTSASLLSLRAMKLVCIALLIGNAIALYFIETYNVLLDKTMMGNVVDTDRQQTFDLFHPKIIVYLFLLGLLPASIVATTSITGSTRLRRLRLLIATVVFGAAMVYAGSSTWPWFDEHAKRLGGLMLPWSYLANTTRYLEAVADANRKQVPLPPLHFIPNAHPERKIIVVLVIGESARASNFSLYGYGRNTNPELAKAGVIVLPDVHACATYTTAAIRCMLSHVGGDAPANVSQEILPNYLQRHGVEVIWRSNNWGEPPLKIAHYERVGEIRKQYDEALLDRLGEMLARSTSPRIFVVLHARGSHGPRYDRDVPEAFARFQPVCASVDVSTCTHASLVNAYDNTIVYTDHFLADTIKLLEAVPDSASTMIYISDHGESLGERGFYLHGAPNSVAPDVQRDVPFLVWMSPAFSEAKAISPNEILSRAPFGDDNVFHSVLGAFGGSSTVYKPSLDLFSHSETSARHLH